MAQGGPNFLTVDHVMVAHPFGTGFQSGQVRSSAGLGVTLHPKIITFADPGQELFFLRWRTELQQHRRTHRRAKGRQTWSAGQGKFFVVDIALGDVPARTAPLHRPMRHRPAFGGQNFVPAQILFFAQAFVVLNFLADIGG